MVHRLSPEQARRIAVRAQLLDVDRPANLAEVVRGLSMLQLDPTAAVAPNAHLVAWSRLGSAYAMSELDAALEDRSLIELRGMVRPAGDIALYRAEMEHRRTGELAGWRRQQREWVQANEACRRDILATLSTAGPLPSRELPDTCVVPWRSSGWTDNKNVPQLLECLVVSGEVAVAGRDGRERLWDLAERVYPDEPAPDRDEAKRLRDGKRLRALGIARAKGPECQVEPVDVGEAGEPAVIDGTRGSWRVDPSFLDGAEPADERATLLSPLDRLVFDRKRMADIFGFDYQLEMYKPAARRKWGYFALPILYGDELVGKLDVTADRRAGVLRVAAVHDDIPFSGQVSDAIDGQIAELGRWLSLEVAMPVRR